MNWNNVFNFTFGRTNTFSSISNFILERNTLIDFRLLFMTGIRHIFLGRMHPICDVAWVPFVRNDMTIFNFNIHLGVWWRSFGTFWDLICVCLGPLLMANDVILALYRTGPKHIPTQYDWCNANNFHLYFLCPKYRHPAFLFLIARAQVYENNL